VELGRLRTWEATESGVNHVAARQHDLEAADVCCAVGVWPRTRAPLQGVADRARVRGAPGDAEHQVRVAGDEELVKPSEGDARLYGDVGELLVVAGDPV
jgi:hypothetical protein